MRRCAIGLALAAVVAIQPSAAADGPHLAGAVDLTAPIGLQIDGAAAGDQAGSPVEPVGDVNGDGRTDFAVGAGHQLFQVGQPLPDGSVNIVFGGPTQGEIDLASLGDGGFRVALPSATTAQYHAAAAGDVNGDGLGDVVLSHDSYPAEDGSGGVGRAFVVFGKRDSSPVDVRSLGGHGFAIKAFEQYQSVGRSVAGLGDVNGDGLADVLVSAPSTKRPVGSGVVYVVYGKKDSADVRLDELTGRGYEIASEQQLFGSNAASAGDVNGDGIADVLAGASTPDGGATYVVFGKRDSSPVDADTTAGAIRIVGAPGEFLTGAGDVNGDGLGDVAVLARNALVTQPDRSLLGFLIPPHFAQQGILYVVFGRRQGGEVRLASLGDQGFRVPAGQMSLTHGLRPAGDLNGDGLADLLVSGESGSSYAIFGKRDPADLSLDALGDRGFYIRAPETPGVAGTGDFDGDGRVDLLLGSRDADPKGRADAGMALFTHLGFPPGLAAGDCANPSSGTARADALPGTPAGDTSHGLAGDDFLGGQAGGDCLDGGAGDDLLQGGAGNDRLTGGPDADILSGGDGDDMLVGNRGRDRFDAGAGNDRLDAVDGAAETVDCGPGEDTARLDRFDHPRGCEHVTRARRAPSCVQPRLKLSPAPRRKRLSGLRIRVFDPDSKIVGVYVDWGDSSRPVRAAPRATRPGRQHTRVIHHGLRGKGPFTARGIALAAQPKGCGANADRSAVARTQVR